jgi:hypothetical protein
VALADPGGTGAPHGCVGIDGHDGSGKTTIALEVARRLGATYARPFGGDVGARLMAAVGAGPSEVIRVGDDALRAAADVPEGSAVILDRSWLTVASLTPDEDFTAAWTLWLPTVLCWADLPTTLARLAVRDEAAESERSHRYYIARYRDLAASRGVPVVDTSGASVAESTLRVLGEVRRLLRSNTPRTPP